MINCQDFHSIFRGFPMREAAEDVGGKSGKKPFCRSFGELWCYSLLLALFSPHPSILLLPQPPYYLYIIVWLGKKSGSCYLQTDIPIIFQDLFYIIEQEPSMNKRRQSTQCLLLSTMLMRMSIFSPGQTYNSNTPSLLNSIWRQKNDLFRFPKERHIKDILKGLHRSLNCA